MKEESSQTELPNGKGQASEPVTPLEKRTSARPKITAFAHYKDHVIDVEQCGHPHAQNVYIDGNPVGYVIFPTSAIATGRSIIDARIAVS